MCWVMITISWAGKKKLDCVYKCIYMAGHMVTFDLMWWLLDILKKKNEKKEEICDDFTAGAVCQQELFRLLWSHNCLRHVMFWRDIRLTSLTFQRYRLQLLCFLCFSFVLIVINIYMYMHNLRGGVKRVAVRKQRKKN